VPLQYSVVMSPSMQNAVDDGSLILHEVDQDEDAVTEVLRVLAGTIKAARSGASLMPMIVGLFYLYILYIRSLLTRWDTSGKVAPEAHFRHPAL
jgi:hypothetical protein